MSASHTVSFAVQKGNHAHSVTPRPSSPWPLREASYITAVFITIGPSTTALFMSCLVPITHMPMCRTMDREIKIFLVLLILTFSFLCSHTGYLYTSNIPTVPKQNGNTGDGETLGETFLFPITGP